MTSISEIPTGTAHVLVNEKLKGFYPTYLDEDLNEWNSSINPFTQEPNGWESSDVGLSDDYKPLSELVDLAKAEAIAIDDAIAEDEAFNRVEVQYNV